jgi:hypothetical protein
MDAKKIFTLLKEEIPLPDGVERRAMNKVLYGAAQAVYSEALKWCKAQVREHTGKEADILIKRLEPMEPDEMRQTMLLMISEFLDNRDVDAIKKLMEVTDKIYGVGGDSRPVVNMVDFGGAYDKGGEE